MGLREDLEDEVDTIIRYDGWTEREGTTVPEPESLALRNEAVKLHGTVLYADLAESTSMVDSHPAHFAAEVYKAYLHCAAKVIRAEGGSITAYDGDRIMAVFLGKAKNTSAARAGLKINHVCKQIINPAIKVEYPEKTFTLKQTVGIDTSELFVARTGIRGSNDLVWVGRAANYAAKLAGLDEQYPTWITGTVYDSLNSSVKTAKDGRRMWEERVWTPMDRIRIYRSNWWWPI